MALNIKPDRRHPLGGYAVVGLGSVAAASASLVIRRLDDGACLGPHGWQGSAHSFGPFPVEGPDAARHIRIGPEIVNYLDAYLAVELSLPEAGITETLTWPESVVPSPDFHEGGGVEPSSVLTLKAPKQHIRPGAAPAAPEPPPAPKPAPASEPTLVYPEPKPEPALAPEPAADPEPVLAAEPRQRVLEPNPDPEPESGGKVRLAVILSILALILAAALWFAYAYLSQKEEVAPPPPPPPPTLEPVCTGDSAMQALRDPAHTVQSIRAMVQGCGVSAETLQARALLVDWLAQRGEAAALLQWGRWNDPTEPGASPFQGAQDLTIAVDYYRRAIAAGAAEARPLLERACTNLRGKTDPLSRMAVNQHCQ